ncbi:hypothetical protein [Archangium lansingense]|uniref:Uncharacterized protein n=1 Tax=Archangium lansingense TaxID=2995310 RepID=A0ABT4AJD5_9BACT|nr:hypothetical protein [Archangium lansinium]MCY1081808.1 hypothetical protein [Archangium lansinium]
MGLIAWLELRLAGTDLPQRLMGGVLVCGDAAQQELTGEALELIDQYSPERRAQRKGLLNRVVATEKDSSYSREIGVVYVNFREWTDAFSLGVLLLYYLEHGRMFAALPKVRLPDVKARIRASWIAPRRFAAWYGETHDLEEEEVGAMMEMIEAIKDAQLRRAERTGLYWRVRRLLEALRL